MQEIVVKPMVMEGVLYNSASDYMILKKDNGESIEIDDTLIRSKFLGLGVRITIEQLQKECQ